MQKPPPIPNPSALLLPQFPHLLQMLQTSIMGVLIQQLRYSRINHCHHLVETPNHSDSAKARRLRERHMPQQTLRRFEYLPHSHQLNFQWRMPTTRLWEITQASPANGNWGLDTFSRLWVTISQRYHVLGIGDDDVYWKEFLALIKDRLRSIRLHGMVASHGNAISRPHN